MKPIYDEEYTYVFHSPGIEPWILGLLKSKPSLGRVLDVGCGLGFSALMLKLYLGSVEYLVGVDVSLEKVRKAERARIDVEGLIKRGYSVYRYLLRGFVLIDLESYDIYLAWQSSRFLRVLKLFLTILIPLLKITRILEKGYILAFK
jgi:SAM-dependent methyltransferase